MSIQSEIDRLNQIVEAQKQLIEQINNALDGKAKTAANSANKG